MRVSIQIYTIRQETERDFLGACERLAAMGFQWVELAGNGGFEPKELAKRLRDLGLGISGAHIPVAVIEETERFVDECNELGVSSATVPGLPQEMRDSAAAWRETGAKLEIAAQRFRDAGLRLGYHNHDIEFQEFEANTGLDWLIASAPTLDVQLDMYWAAKAGADPAFLTKRFAGRMPSVHFKDLGEDGNDIEFGQGILNWGEILAACESGGVETLVLEMDNPRHAPLESARMCLEGINRLPSQELRT